MYAQTIAAAHWPQLEKPEDFNAILRRWLGTLPEPENRGNTNEVKSEDEAPGRIVDEL